MYTLSNTTIYNDLLKALDTGMTVYLNDDGEYMTLRGFEWGANNGAYGIDADFGMNSYIISPSIGASESELYTPSNIASPNSGDSGGGDGDVK